VKDITIKKKTKNIATVTQPALTSTSFWQPEPLTESTTQHWLHATSLPPVTVSPVAPEQSCLIADLVMVESPTTAHFASTVAATHHSIENLTDNKSTSPVPKRSLTWTPPSRSSSVEKGTADERPSLWTPSSSASARNQQTTAETQEMTLVAFENVVRKNSFWTRPSVFEAEVTKFENKELWRLSRTLRETPRDWLTGSERRASKVQFRY
jgi:hypothetical protein